jgi:uncharacterized protein YgiM (DUF1202 family)
MKTRTFWIFTFLALALASCTNTPTEIPTPTLAPTERPTATLIPTQEILPTDTPEPTSTVETFTPFTVTVATESVNLRSNPGYLFAVVELIGIDTTLTVEGRSLGGEWLYVVDGAGTHGWIFNKLVTSETDLLSAPVIEPDRSQLLTGKLVDENGGPVSGVQFAITQGTGDTTKRTDAMTDGEGIFYAYMPPNLSGVWEVTFTAVACTSNTMDANCNCLGGQCGTAEPFYVSINLPQAEELEFTWK